MATASGDEGPLALNTANLAAIAGRGVPVPTYDRQSLVPRIAHIGVGGFHRAHLAVYLHELAEAGGDWAIRGLGLLPGDAAMAAALGTQDCLYSLVEKGAGQPTTAVIGSIVDYRHTAARPQETIDVLADPKTAIVSMTVTESGYALDIPAGSTFDVIAHALDQRRRTSGAPVTILSCDNLPGNGDTARRTVLAASRRSGPAVDVVGRVGVQVPELDGRSHHPGDVGSRPHSSPRTRRHRRPLARCRRAVPAVGGRGRLRRRETGSGSRSACSSPTTSTPGAVQAAHPQRRPLVHGLSAAPSPGSPTSTRRWPCPRSTASSIGCSPRRRCRRSPRSPAIRVEDYAATVLGRFANPGVRDQIARLCIDGTAKYPTFLIPTIEYHVANGGPVRHAALALAGWARYLATVPVEQQSPDAAADLSRRHAVAAVDDPARFLEPRRRVPRRPP